MVMNLADESQLLSALCESSKSESHGNFSLYDSGPVKSSQCGVLQAFLWITLSLTRVGPSPYSSYGGCFVLFLVPFSAYFSRMLIEDVFLSTPVLCHPESVPDPDYCLRNQRLVHTGGG